MLGIRCQDNTPFTVSWHKLTASERIILTPNTQHLTPALKEKFYERRNNAPLPVRFHSRRAPPDPILGLTEKFNADPSPQKVNLGVGVYQDENGKTPLLRAVHEAETRLLEKEGAKSYLPIDGLKIYNQSAQRLLFGADSPVISAGRAVTLQALGGTGALKIGADFLKRFVAEGAAPLYISDPSWENHRALFEMAGFDVRTYPYYDAETQSVRFAEMTQTLRDLPAQTPVVLHACCHNPTGLDLTPEQWRNVAETCAARRLLPFLDFAYQGFAEGPEPDAYAVRLFGESGLSFLVAQSFSKSFSLYGERIGSLTFVTRDADEAKRVLSQVKRVVRTNYSSPATRGGAIVADDSVGRGTDGAMGIGTDGNARTHPENASAHGGKTAGDGRGAGLRFYRGAARNVLLFRPDERASPETARGASPLHRGQRTNLRGGAERKKP